MFQRFIYILIALVLVIKIAGFYPLFKIKQWDIRRNIELAIKEKVFNEPLEKISIPSKNVKGLKWERDGKEFWHQGNLYDIVRSETEGEITHFYCINDSEEAELNHELTASIIKETNTTESSDTSVIDFFKKVIKIYYPNHFKHQNDVKWVFLTNESTDFIVHSNFYKSANLQSSKPPPRFV